MWGRTLCRIVVVGRRHRRAVRGVAGFYQKTSLAPFSFPQFPYYSLFSTRCGTVQTFLGTQRQCNDYQERYSPHSPFDLP